MLKHYVLIDSKNSYPISDKVKLVEPGRRCHCSLQHLDHLSVHIAVNVAFPDESVTSVALLSHYNRSDTSDKLTNHVSRTCPEWRKANLQALHLYHGPA